MTHEPTHLGKVPLPLTHFSAFEEAVPIRRKKAGNLKRVKKISWIIPCFNEERTIGTVVEDILKYCPGSSVFVFDNNSSDGTALVAKQKGATVVVEPRQGKGHVVRSMFRKVDADIYILVDGDTTYDISSWSQLVAPLQTGNTDMVVANRMQSFHGKAFRRFHYFGNRLISTLINITFGTQLHDVLSGYRILS